MIIGVGLDVIATRRIAHALARRPERFLGRILSSRERAALHGDPVAYVAGRFVAKEAAFKALGTGVREAIGWGDIEILNRPTGAPELRLRAGARRQFEQLGATTAHLSLTHGKDQALAMVILERVGDCEEDTRKEDFADA